MSEQRVAIVHPWLVHVRGGEKVFIELARAFPDADLYLLFANLDRCPPDIRGRVRTTKLQQTPLKDLSYRATLPLLPAAIESIDLSSYSLVISSSSGWAHGALAAEGATHLCYMHTPPRYLWGERAPGRAARAVGSVLNPVMTMLRTWDVAAANRVSTFLANSSLTAQRISDRYGRTSTVLHPPTDVEPYLALPRDPQGYALYVGELVEYKRVDLAIDAARRLNIPLLIVGDGPERAALERRAAGADVHFFGRASDQLKQALITGASVFLYGGVEDFGITFVEMLAAGVPVVGIEQGGLAEIGEHGGVSFAEDQSAEAFAEAAAACLDNPSKFVARDSARRFSTQEFVSKFRTIAEGLVPA